MRTRIITKFMIAAGIFLLTNDITAQKKKKQADMTAEEIANIQGHADAYADKDPRSLITDEKVLQNLEEWQDLKFGFMAHWGIYSQMASRPSWPLNDDPLLDKDWGRSEMEQWKESGENIEKFREIYWGKSKEFNPKNFDPERWAALAEKAGMKYFIFTTMHHDGFNMFDSKQTDFKVTHKSVPFSKNKNADVTKVLFEAFRAKGFKIGAYYSKPSWHNKYFWKEGVKVTSRNTNYDVLKEPKTWKKFTKFTHKNINQLLSDYGKVDVLWLDGGWVNPDNKNLDINMDLIAKNGRKKQPGLIVVDRTVHGANENYITPEQRIPDEPIMYPWETNMTMGTWWSYKKDEIYKPTSVIIRNLVDVVAKGGNYVVNLGPNPDGWFDDIAVKQMHEIGKWMDINGTAIYKTKPVAPYRIDDLAFTQNKNGTVNVIYLPKVGEDVPTKIVVRNHDATNIKTVELLGVGNIETFEIKEKELTIFIPRKLNVTGADKNAFVFRLKK